MEERNYFHHLWCLVLDISKLSKEISYALRHAPWESVNETDLIHMIEVADKKRHEIKNGRSRAIYGHSTPQKILRTAATPPSILYHGTARHLVEQIIIKGLQPMARQYVHLSVDINTANVIGMRKDSVPVLLKIQAEKASNEGVKFYQGNSIVWLADLVPSKFISID